MCKGENKRKQQQKPSASFLISRKNLQMWMCWKNADKVQSEELHAGSFWRLGGMNPHWFSIILILVGKKKYHIRLKKRRIQLLVNESTMWWNCGSILKVLQKRKLWNNYSSASEKCFVSVNKPYKRRSCAKWECSSKRGQSHNVV